jgi:hypothetical protein
MSLLTRFVFGSITATGLGVTATPPGLPWPSAKMGDRDRGGGDADQRGARVHPPAFAFQLDVESAQGFEVVGEPGDLELVEPLALVEVLEPPLAEVADRDAGRQVFFREFLGGRGEQHLAAVAGVADPRCPVHADPHVPLPPTFGSPVCEPIRTVTWASCGQACAARSRCASTAASTASLAVRKATKNESPLAIDLLAVGREGCAQDPRVLCEQLGVAAAELLEQPSRPFDVHEQEGDGAAVKLRREPPYKTGSRPSETVSSIAQPLDQQRSWRGARKDEVRGTLEMRPKNPDSWDFAFAG